MPTPRYLAGEKLSASKLQQLATEDNYTPTLHAATGSDPDLGTSPVQSGLLWLSGQLVFASISITIGTSPTIQGTDWELALPAAYPLDAGVHDNAPIGLLNLIDANTGTHAGGIVLANNTPTRVGLRLFDDTYVAATNPWTFAAGDRLIAELAYLTDFGA